MRVIVPPVILLGENSSRKSMGHWIFMVLLGFAATKGIWSVGPAVRDCESYEIMKCLQSTQNEGQLFLPETQQKLREYCRNILAGLDCAKSLIEHCASKSEREMYYNLTKDMVGMNAELCSPGSKLSSRFLKHVDCFKSMSDRFKVCSDRFFGNMMVVQSLSENEEVMGMTCCTANEYNRCMRNAVEGRCDQDAQQLIQDSVGTAFKQLTIKCKTLGEVPTSNCMKRYSPGNNHETSNLNDENGAKHFDIPFSLLFLLCLLVLSKT